MAINLGNIVKVGDRTVSSGAISGIDVETLVNQLTDAKRIPATELEDKIEINASKISAYTELRTKLDALKTVTNFLRHPTGIGAATTNAFEYRAATLSSSSIALPSSYLTASASPGAALGAFSIAVGNIAQAQQWRSQSFASKTADVTEAGGGATAGKFSAGTFRLAATGPTPIELSSSSSDQIATSEYSVTGSGSGVVTAAGIHNITTVGNNGDKKLKGTVSSFAGSYNSGAGTATMSVVINGTTYTSNAFAANNAVTGGNGITAGTTITFTGGNGTTFDIITASDVVIDATQANLTTFANNVTTGVAAQKIYQSRELGNFSSAAIANTTISAMTSANVKLKSNEFDNSSSGLHGDIQGFTIVHVGADNNTMSVIIDGETYQATGLLDSHTANITLTNTTDSNKTLSLNINAAGVTLAMADQTAADAREAELDYMLGIRRQASVTLGAGDSLVDIVSSINTQTSQSGVSASILQVSGSDFRLVLQSVSTGTANGFTTIDPTGVLTQVTFTTVQAAEDALVKINGVEVTRSGNSISDAVSGLTLNLLQETPDYGLGGEDTVVTTVSRDTVTASNNIANFINAYNDFRLFVAKQTERDENGEYTEDAVLGSETLLLTVIRQLGTEITKAVSGTSDSDFTNLADMGITLEDFAGDDENPAASNLLTYDTAELADKLASNFDKLREILEFTFQANSNDLQLFRSSNGITITDFQLDIDTSRAAGQKVRVLNSTGTFLYYAELSGNKITGADGTSIEGLEMLYTGDGTDVITVGVSQGIADRMYNILGGVLEDDGSLDKAVESVTENSENLQDEIDGIDEQIEDYRDFLLSKFSALEEAIARVNTLLDFLDVNSKGIFNSKS